MILERVRQIRGNHPRMGGKKLHYLLGEYIDGLGIGLGRDKFFDLLRANDLLVKRRRKHVTTTQSFKRFFLYKDHYNGFAWRCPHQAWVSDITYIRIEDGFWYLFLITDAFSRKIIGWQLAPTLETKWALKALRMAVKQCPDTTNVVHHSDRGFQYCSGDYIKLLKEQKAIPSMGEAGYCYDNAMAERVNGILKDEYFLDSTFKTPGMAIAAVKQAILKYNEERPHWSLGLQIPAQVHKAA